MPPALVLINIWRMIMFQNALPIWLKNRETEINLTVQFKAFCPKNLKTSLRIATSGIYNLWVNGVFAAYGPARAGKDHFRMDQIPIDHLLTQERNSIVIEVCGYNAFSFEVQKQPSFLQAELVADGQIIAWTGRDFSARVHPFRRRRTQRYSFQRVLSESYHITDNDAYKTDSTVGTEPICITEGKCIIARHAPYPQYEISDSMPILSGTVAPTTPDSLRQDRAWLNVSDHALTGFPIADLEVYPTAECQYFSYTPSTHCQGEQMASDSYTIYRLPHNMTGMLRWTITCQAPITLYVLFDEILTENRVDFLRMECANAIRYDLCPGTHTLQTFNVYTMQYIQMTVIGAPCTLTAPVVVQYKHPPVQLPFTPSSPALQKIADAAVETYRQNAVDIFMDCPSRERAGWLCDSFFTSRVEKLLTGQSSIENSFLENFLHEEHYAALPDGMFPMCYPADHRDGVFIPQWAMWLVVELREYALRGGSDDLIKQYCPRIKKLLQYFEAYENEDGLLEDLDGWNFVEWSQANQLCKNVNYPTNMLYSYMLHAVADLYGNEELAQKADRVMQTVRDQSYDGQFFVDNAIRRDGKLVPSGERTEVCQYYAFFFGAAAPQTHPELLQILVEEFGPDRASNGKWPEIWPANAFIGNYLRLDMLMQLGYHDTVRQNIEGYFLYMAETTGTLWENVGASASCNHGFASYVLYWLNQLNT